MPSTMLRVSSATQKRHSGFSMDSKAVDNTWQQDLCLHRSCWPKVAFWMSAPAQQGDWALCDTHRIPWSCSSGNKQWRTESSNFLDCDSRNSSVLELSWSSVLSSSTSSKRRIATKIWNVVSHPFMSCTQWANILWASLASLYKSPKATIGLALRLPQHPLLFLKYVLKN